MTERSFIVIYYKTSDYDYYDGGGSYEHSEFSILPLETLNDVAKFIVTHDRFVWMKEIVVLQSWEDLTRYLEIGFNYDHEDELLPNDIYINKNLAKQLKTEIEKERIVKIEYDSKIEQEKENFKIAQRKLLYEQLKKEFEE